jgi:hypothetical protein
MRGKPFGRTSRKATRVEGESARVLVCSGSMPRRHPVGAGKSLGHVLYSDLFAVHDEDTDFRGRQCWRLSRGTRLRQSSILLPRAVMISSSWGSLATSAVYEHLWGGTSHNLGIRLRRRPSASPCYKLDQFKSEVERISRFDAAENLPEREIAVQV